MRRIAAAFSAVVVAVMGLVAVADPAGAASVPAGFTNASVTAGLQTPTAMEFAPDGRIFVSEKNGTVRIVQNGAVLPTPFLTVTVDNLNERGLLGLTLDPDFGDNGWVYVFYTATTPNVHTRISRFTAAGDVAVSGSELVLVDFAEPAAIIHQGGAMHFGPDGKLYVAVGDNGLPENAQNLTNRFGKILRYNPDGSIPSDNPFPFATNGAASIWAYGLRNAFTFAFQPGGTRMYANDVGLSVWEEVNDIVKGGNYGWPLAEGTSTNPAFRNPVHAYHHDVGSNTGCAVTGGAFYNPTAPRFPASYVGRYYFADFCKGWIHTLNPNSPATFAPFAEGMGDVVDLDVGADGKLYYLGHYSGMIGRISYAPAAPPTVVDGPAAATVAVGESASFTVSVEGSEPYSYQWQRNGVAITGATAASLTLPTTTLGDDGSQYRVVVSNSHGSTTSAAATLDVVAGSRPTVTITSPAVGSKFSGGQTISWSATGTDADDGPLAPSAFTWGVAFHHDTHVHPHLPDATGASSGSFTTADVGHNDIDTYYRLSVTVRDSSGLTRTAVRDMDPNVVSLTLNSAPAGLRVLLDGSPRVTPSTIQTVAGMRRSIGVESPQPSGLDAYTFGSWSDGGAQSHMITVPPSDSTFTANLNKVVGDLVEVNITGGAPFAVNGTAVSGNLKLTKNSAGKLVTLNGTSVVLGPHGNPVTVIMAVSKVGWLDSYSGSVTVTDPLTKYNKRFAFWLTKAYVGPPPNLALGTFSVLDTSTLPWKTNYVTWRVTDRA